MYYALKNFLCVHTYENRVLRHFRLKNTSKFIFRKKKNNKDNVMKGVVV